MPETQEEKEKRMCRSAGASASATPLWGTGHHLLHHNRFPHPLPSHLQCWMFSVRCWMFALPLPFTPPCGTRARRSCYEGVATRSVARPSRSWAEPRATRFAEQARRMFYEGVAMSIVASGCFHQSPNQHHPRSSFVFRGERVCSAFWGGRLVFQGIRDRDKKLGLTGRKSIRKVLAQGLDDVGAQAKSRLRQFEEGLFEIDETSRRRIGEQTRRAGGSQNNTELSLTTITAWTCGMRKKCGSPSGFRQPYAPATRHVP